MLNSTWYVGVSNYYLISHIGRFLEFYALSAYYFRNDLISAGRLWVFVFVVGAIIDRPPRKMGILLRPRKSAIGIQPLIVMNST